MTPVNITTAIKVLNPLLTALEAAYWDAFEIGLKDRLFDLIRCVNGELNELAKLSVSDLDLPYETITPQFGNACDKLSYIYSQIDHLFPRTKTAQELKATLPEAASLINACVL